MGRRAVSLRGDMHRSDEIVTLVKAAEAELGPIDIVISNAGAGNRKQLTEISMEEWDETMNVNLRAVFVLAQPVAPEMQKRHWVARLHGSAGPQSS